MGFPLILNLYKRAGETPLERIERFKKENPRYEEMSMTYAGRLDPAAEGVLVVLAGDAIHEKKKYLKLSKEYVAHILFGFESDTYDTLGIAKAKQCEGIDENTFKEKIKEMQGSQIQEYPPYSSRTVETDKTGEGKKPLWKLAREGKVNEVEMPKQEIEVMAAELIRLYTISQAPLLAKVHSVAGGVEGDFRQAEILEVWRELLSDDSALYSVAAVRFNVSSGTYIRSLAHELGRKLGCGAVVLSLTRTRVGDFTLKGSL